MSASPKPASQAKPPVFHQASAEIIKKPTTPKPEQQPTISSSTPNSVIKKEKTKRQSSEEASGFIVNPEPRGIKIYPELPVPQTEGIDKHRQHQDDIAEAKKRLEEARQRKIVERLKSKEFKKGSKRPKSSKVEACNSAV